ncbi:MAG: PIN domain-containing protein [Gammaproteobacteria bacterium]
MYVILDSNIWISELGLKSTLGAAARFYLKRNDAILVLPEVIKLESERNLRSRLNEHISSIRKSHAGLLSVFGTLKEVVLPKENDVDAVIDGLFANLDVEIRHLPFSLESAKSSFLKTIEKVPPSDKSQQFKDGVLWADCVALLKENDVHLVTEDKAFYENRQYQNGIAKNLLAEISDIDNTLSIYPSLLDLMQSIQTDIAIEPSDLLASFLDINKDSVDRSLERAGFELEGVSDSVISSFATENPSVLYVEFEILVSCQPVVADGRDHGRLILTGDGQLDLDTGNYRELRNFGEEFLYTAADGSEEKTKNHVLYADSLVIGHKEVKHSVRYKLD